MIRNLHDLAEMLSAEPNQDSIMKHVYKYTQCGAWIDFTKDGIRLGSIVEGADFGTAIYPLKYPFSEGDYRAREAAIEAEAAEIWKWANEGPPDGDQTWAQLGVEAPDVDVDYRHLGQDGRSA